MKCKTMTTDYNNFAKTFSQSRKNMKWEELEYFFSHLTQGSILDIGCGSGRLLEQYEQHFTRPTGEYLWIDMSSGLISEAQKAFPDKSFIAGNMLDLQSILWDKKYDNFFLIASFHHLETLEQREQMMKQLFAVAKPWAKIFMTNWALESPQHLEKYRHAKVAGSKSKFGWSDFNIKFWKHDRFYHNFSLTELEYLSQTSGFTIIENRLFESEKNIITILQK